MDQGESHCGQKCSRHRDSKVEAKFFGIVGVKEGEVVELILFSLLVCVFEIAIQHQVVCLMLLEEIILDPLLLIQIPGLFVVQVDLIVLVLQLPEVFKVDSSRVKDLLALRVNEDDFLVLLELLASLDVFLAIFLTHVNGRHLALRLFNKFEHIFPLLFWRQGIQLLMNQGFRLVREGRVGVPTRSEFRFREGDQGTWHVNIF